MTELCTACLRSGARITVALRDPTRTLMAGGSKHLMPLMRPRRGAIQTSLVDEPSA